MRDLPKKFKKINDSGTGKPALVVALQSNVFYVEQVRKEDWANASAYSFVDWTPTPPVKAGDVILQQTTDIRYENQSVSNLTDDFCTGVAGFYKEHWQSFEQNQGCPRKLTKVRVYLRAASGSEFYAYCQLYSSGKGSALSSEIVKYVATAGGWAWVEFDFTSQNIIINPDMEYWFKIRHSGGTLTGQQQIACGNSELYYSGGRRDIWNSLIGWLVAQGDMVFEVRFTGQHGYYYMPSGSITTQTMSLSSVPAQTGEWFFSDIIPLGTRLTYEAWCTNSPGMTFPSSWESIGTVVDGDRITNLKQFYRVRGTFYSNAYRDETPILSGIRADFSNYELFSNRGGLGLPVTVQDVSNLSMSIDFFKGSTIGQIDINFAATPRVRRWLALSRPKNKMVKVRAGFIDDRPLMKIRNLVLPTSDALAFEEGPWYGQSSATPSITQGQADPIGGYTATRIQTWSGESSIKYIFYPPTSGGIAPTNSGTYYYTSVWVKSLGPAVRFGSNIDGATGSVVVSADGEFHQVQILQEGTGNYWAPRFDAMSVAGSLDLIAWRPLCEINNQDPSWQNPMEVVAYNAWLADDRFKLEDFIDYRWGVIDDYQLEDDVVTITMKDFSKEWNQDVPIKWQNATDDVTWTGSHHCDIIKDVLLNRIGIRDSKLDTSALNVVKDQTSGYVATHKITGNPMSGKDIVDQLRILTASFFIYTPTGAIKLKRWDPTEEPVVSLTDKHFISKRWEANDGELYNRCVHYFNWVGSGDDAKDFTAFKDTPNSNSMVQYQETATFTFKDQWTTVANSRQVGELHTIINSRYSDPPPPIFRCEVDRKYLAVEVGDFAAITTTCAPSSDGIGIVEQNFQVIETNLNFMEDRIAFAMKKV